MALDVYLMEQTLLGAILRDNAQLEAVMDIVTVADFSEEAHKQVYAAMLRLKGCGKPIDFFMLEQELSSFSGGPNVWFYVAQLASNVPIESARNAEAYATELRINSGRNKLATALDYCKQQNESRVPLPELLEKTSAELNEISNLVCPKKTGTMLSDGLSILLDELSDLMDGNEEFKLNTGFKQLDGLLNGMRAGNLVVLAGRPSMGKTTFAINILRNILLYHEMPPCLFFSFEMNVSEILRSLICCTGGLPLNDLKRSSVSDSSLAKLTYATGVLNKAPLKIVTQGSTIGMLKAEARNYKKKYPALSFILIDYLGMISKPKSENRNLEIGAITRELKLLAGELQIPILLLSQLNRDSDKKNDTTPQLHNLRDSGSVEQDADVVMFVHRKDRDRNVKIIVAKNRSGACGEVPLIFDGATATFKDEVYDKASY